MAGPNGGLRERGRWAGGRVRPPLPVLGPLDDAQVFMLLVWSMSCKRLSSCRSGKS